MFGKCKINFKNLKSLNNLILLSKDKKFEDLLNIDGIGETQINSIKNFFSNNTNLKVFNELAKLMEVKNSTQQKKWNA